MSIQKLDPQQAKRNLEIDKNSILIDIRTEAEYKEGYIPGCMHIPLAELADTIQQVAQDYDKPIYYYCRSGVRTITAGIVLEQLGYTNLYDIGGILNWPYEICRD
ncbi:MAG: rhodanese-like domain-containing protein [Cellulosilyticaceae bacterium]